jgi:mycothiol synthase
MPSAITTLSSCNAPAVARLLQASLPVLSPDLNHLLLHSLLAPGWREELALVACQDSQPVAYLQAFPPRSPNTDGYVTLFTVREDCHNRGIGTQLFELAESRLAALGAQRICIAPYGPAYWVPGVDVNLFPDAARFLERRGYAVIGRPIAMEADLTRLPAQRPHSKVVCTEFNPESAFEVSALLKQFSEDWQHTVHQCMQQILKGLRPPSNLMLARQNGALCAFAHVEHERFGPFGTLPARRGEGIGSALLQATLASMRAQGMKRAWFMWTGEALAQKMYAPVGFVQTNIWNVYAKPVAAP